MAYTEESLKTFQDINDLLSEHDEVTQVQIIEQVLAHSAISIGRCETRAAAVVEGVSHHARGMIAAFARDMEEGDGGDDGVPHGRGH